MSRQKVFTDAAKAELKSNCQECGAGASWRHGELVGALMVHHKDGDYRNNSPENLVTLCAHCHYMEHRPDSKRGGPRKTPDEFIMRWRKLFGKSACYTEFFMPRF